MFERQLDFENRKLSVLRERLDYLKSLDYNSFVPSNPSLPYEVNPEYVKTLADMQILNLESDIESSKEQANAIQYQIDKEKETGEISKQTQQNE